MSNYPQGRRVTDPKPVVHVKPGDPLYDAGLTDLASAWGSLRKARTTLKRAEQRAVEAELVPGMDITNSTKSSHVIEVDPVPRLKQSDSLSTDKGTYVDDHGRTLYLKNKMYPMRKVSRLGDKYTEAVEVPSIRSCLKNSLERESIRDGAHEIKLRKYLDIKQDRTGLSSHSTSSSAGSANLTDSRALRETDVRILNEHSRRSDRSYESDRHEPRLTHVDVTVPRSIARSGHTGGQNAAPLKTVPESAESKAADRGTGEFLVTRKGEIFRKEDMRKIVPRDVTYTAPSSSTEGSAKLNKKLKPDKEQDGLRRLREMIMQRRQESERKQQEEAQQLLDLQRKTWHAEDEQVVPKSYQMYNNGTQAPKLRKVAAGPPVPVYKGFNEAETRVRTRDGKVVRLNETRRKTKPKPESAKPAKQDKPAEAPAEKSEVKNKKPGRVIANMKKPSKYEKKDIITTSSWRAGQKLILQELGPNKLPRTGDLLPTKEKPHQDEPEPDHMMEVDDTDMNVVNDEAKDRSLPMSDDARNVLRDLQLEEKQDMEDEQLDADVTGPKQNKKGESSRRSRKHKSTGSEQDKKSAAKVRHYDTSEVRRYMAKQRAERKKRQEAEKEAQRRAEDLKQKHLEELYQKQKESFKAPGKGKQDEIPGAPPKKMSNDISSLPRHHPFRQDYVSGNGSSGSDKENHRGHKEQMPWSDDTDSTLTGESMDELTPKAEQRIIKTKETDVADTKEDRIRQGIQEVVRSKQMNVDEIINKYLQQEKEKQEREKREREKQERENVQTKDSGIGTATGDLVKRYLQDIEPARGSGLQKPDASIGRIEMTRPLSSMPGTSTKRDVSRPSTAPTGAFGGHSSGSPSREERLEAIKRTAASLGARLQASAAAFQQNGPAGLQSALSDVPEAWVYQKPAGAFRPVEKSQDEEDLSYLGRPEKVSRTKDDYSVFTRDLPGVTSLNKTAARIETDKTRDAAATKIQAMYRGHSVRQSLGWKVASPRSTGRIREMDELDTDDDSALSDSTLTDDISTGPPDLHIHLGGASAYRSQAATDKMDHLNFGKASDYRALPTKSSWDVPNADPYSVMNIFSRRRDRVALGSKDVPGYTPLDDDSDVVSVTPDVSSQSEPLERVNIKATVNTDLQPQPAKSPTPRSVSYSTKSPVSQRTKTPVIDSYQDDFTSATSLTGTVASKRDSVQAVSAGTSAPKAVSKAASGDLDAAAGEDEEDTLDDSITPGLESEDESKGEPDSRSLVPSSRHQPAEESDVSHDDLDMDKQDPLHQYRGTAMSPRQYRHQEMYDSYAAGRMAPAALELRMAAELNRLDSLEETMRQLTGVERTRAVSLAQQETVSLAQILKARQQTHSKEIAELQLKAQQESLAASQQLHEAQRKATDATKNAATAIAEIRSDSTATMQQNAQKLLQTQTEAAQATAEAARQLVEARLASVEAHNISRITAESASAAATAAVQAALQQYPPALYRPVDQAKTKSYASSRHDSFTKTDLSYSSESMDESYTKSAFTKHSDITSATSAVKTATDLSRAKPLSLKTASVVTAIDSSMKDHLKTDSSIRTEPGAAGVPLSARSKGETIAEEIPSDKEDYSMEFEVSITESETEEKSFRDVLPSEVHRRKAKKDGSLSDAASYSSDDPSMSRRLSIDDISVPFIGEDSFARFTTEMVKQYMREEEIRAQHQTSLLKLRERALKEKTRAELAWLDQQKQQLRDKKADDMYPVINKKRRGLKMRLQQEQAEIKRLQEANKAARKERLFLLTQAHEISKLRHSTNQVKAKLKTEGPPDGAPGAASEASMHQNTTEGISRTPSPYKDYKSDSEVYTESSGDKGRPQSPDARTLQKLKKMTRDERYLTVREQKLHQRRKNAADLLAWKHRLDEEEASVYEMEQKALAAWEKKKAEKKRLKNKKTKTEDAGETEMLAPGKAGIKPASLAEPSKVKTQVQTPGHSASEESITEDLDSRDKHPALSGSESSIPDEVSEAKSVPSQASSIPEEVPSGSAVSSSITEEVPSDSNKDRKTQDSSDDTIVNSSVNEEYSNDTFESATEVTQTKSHAEASKKTSPPSPRRLKDRVPQEVLTRSPRSPFSSNNRRGSESESDDSYSMPHSETPSDQSDTEGRVRALTEELKRRKLEAERLKKESKKRHKDRLKQQEASLKKQIEAYDTYINQVKHELEQESIKSHTVKPQIKHPHVKSKQIRRKGDETDQVKDTSKDTSQTRDESSHYSPSTSLDESRDTSTTFSSIKQDDSSGPMTPSPHKTDSGRPSLEIIKELSETSASERRTSTPDKGEELSPLKSPGRTETPVSEDIQEVFSHHTDTSVSVPRLKLDLDESQHRDDDIAQKVAPSSSRTIDYSEDFDTEPKVLDSARSLAAQSESEIPEEYTVHTARSETESVSVGLDLAGTKDIKPDTPEPERTPRRMPSVSEETEPAESETEAHSQTEDLSRKSEDLSRRSEDKSYTSFTNTKSSASRDDYSEEFSYSSSISSRSERIPADKLSAVSATASAAKHDESVPKGEKIESAKENASVAVDEDIHTDEDISEMISSHSDSGGDKVPELTLDLTAEVPSATAAVTGNAQLEREEKAAEPVPAQKSAPAAAKPESDARPEIVESDAGKHESSEPLSARKEHDDSIADDMSVTSDSDLSRAIRSAADSVEQFVGEEGSFFSPRYPRLSPRKGPERDMIIDSITDGITKIVLQDSVSAMSSIAVKKTTETEKETTEAAKVEIEKPSEEPEEPAAAATEDVQEDAEKPQKEKEVKSKAADAATKQLLDEAISQMLTIRKKQKEVPRVEDDTTQELKKLVESDDHEQRDDDFDPFKRPGSPQPHPVLSSDTDFDQDVEMLLGMDGGDFIDDELDFRPSTQKPPPPYPDDGSSTPQPSSGSSSVDLNRLIEEPFYVVPHHRSNVDKLSASAMQVFWQKRRYGESWDDVKPPRDYFSKEDLGSDMESRSKKVYKSLTFDLVGEILKDMYKEEEDIDPPPYLKPKRVTHKYFKGKSPPTMLDVVKPLVTEHTLNYFGLVSKQAVESKAGKCSTRKKKDRVDEILVQELREEEPEWVNYDNDELTVKMQLADSIFDSLLAETSQVLQQVVQKKTCTAS